MEYQYPKINPSSIAALRIVLRDKPDLDAPECPYEPIVKETIKSLTQTPMTTSTQTNLESLDYEQETISLYNSLNTLDSSEVLDPKERISIIKLKTSILQELLDMHKESKRIKEIHHFEDVVFSILTEEQKERLLNEQQ